MTPDQEAKWFADFEEWYASESELDANKKQSKDAYLAAAKRYAPDAEQGRIFYLPVNSTTEEVDYGCIEYDLQDLPQPGEFGLIEGWEWKPFQLVAIEKGTQENTETELAELKHEFGVEHRLYLQCKHELNEAKRENAELRSTWLSPEAYKALMDERQEQLIENAELKARIDAAEKQEPEA